MIRNTRPVSWIKAARKEFERFPGGAQRDILRALTIAAEGRKADTAKPMKGLGSGVYEVALVWRGEAYRTVYIVPLGTDVWVVHAFQKKSTKGIKTPKHEIDLIRERIKWLKEMLTMNEDLELIRGSGNVFRDLGHPRADVEQLKSILAAAIIGELDDRKLSVRKAEGVTGINASEFSRIRTAQLGRFTVDRLMTILNRLNRRVDVQVTTRPFVASEAAPALGAE